MTDKDISDLIIECFDRNKSFSEMVFQTTYISMKNFLSCTVLSRASTFYQTRKFDIFLKSGTVIFSETVQCFSIK